MMNRIFAAAVLGLSVTVCHAQSSVTIYGVVDDAFMFNSNDGGKHQYALMDGAMNSNRWGLKGNEDLGGGWAALFAVEGGFSLNSGAMGNSNTLFGRQSFVGLSGPYGKVTLGRQYSAGDSYTGELSAGGTWAFNGSGAGAHPADVDNLDDFRWINNAIIYATPEYRGLSGKVMYSPGGVPGSTKQNSIIGLGAGYNNENLRVGIGYLIVNNPNYSFYGNNAGSSTTGSNFWSPVDSGFASAGSERIFSVGASYSIGPATLGAVYSNTQFRDLGRTPVEGLTDTENAYRGTQTFNIGELNATYQFSPATLIGVSYSYTHSSGVTSATYHQVNIGFDYSISKRTDFYGGVVYQRAAGTDSRGLPAVANIAAVDPSSGQNQTVALVGISHKF
ncbi:porin [Paraburkholderia sp. CNPSo 3272]|uniref:porin n=1 Tax=Paraburkholderia sp. CNPSo 3272 TaxID=2940931 RepID=UPI0020B8A1EB|nr:porin [Paraburkholderia sp. CNPSo 3272]MCP3727079.1 porin [Paraburkholderia sp. CNPSo 3272]